MKICTSFKEDPKGETTSHEMTVKVVSDEVVIRSSADSELQLLLNVQRKLKYAKSQTELAIESFERKLDECCSRLETLTAQQAVDDNEVQLVHIPGNSRFLCTTIFLMGEIERENIDPTLVVYVVQRTKKFTDNKGQRNETRL